MPRKHLKHIGIVCGIVFILFLCSRLPKPTQSVSEKDQTVSVNTLGQKIFAISQENLKDFQKSEFYRTIIDNNLFRPLGWTTPRQRDPYRLLGTLIPRLGKSKAQAMVQHTATDKTYTVLIGERLGEYTLIDILPKQVTLEKDRQTQTLKLNTAPWIK